MGDVVTIKRPRPDPAYERMMRELARALASTDGTK